MNKRYYGVRGVVISSLSRMEWVPYTVGTQDGGDKSIRTCYMNEGMCVLNVSTLALTGPLLTSAPAPMSASTIAVRPNDAARHNAVFSRLFA